MTMTQLIRAAELLPAGKRKALARRLLRTMPAAHGRPRKWKFSRKGLEEFIAMAGTGHSTYRDVSSNKYKHLAEIYYPRP